MAPGFPENNHLLEVSQSWGEDSEFGLGLEFVVIAVLFLIGLKETGKLILLKFELVKYCHTKKELAIV